MHTYTKDDLLNFVPRHETFVGIDSDGCVFDTMEVKQKLHFHPLIIKSWELEAIEPQLRQAAEFVNLYSKWRGQNRFPALLKVFELLYDWPEVVATGVKLPETDALRAYCNSGLPLGNTTLIEEAGRTGDPELKRLVDWSLAINKDIDDNMGSIPAFKWVRESLEEVQRNSDSIVVSQTPEEALVKEWTEHGMAQYISVVAGQELGTKSEHLEMATKNRYAPEKVLMIGDASGDRKAAEAVGASFYPINPGHEEESWQRFHDEAFGKFLSGEFAGEYQRKLSAEFEKLLPEVPPWKK
ncbi:MAG: HAD hydrolase-like protein [Kiritimatiellales bacterium]|nr:HAD hydrolase-like protein [Kiritimatiellales bacterium]